MATSRRPYLVRAMYEWLVDNDYAPHLLVDVTVDGVEVPDGYARDGKLVLNISPSAVRELDMGNEYVSFQGRFSGRAMTVWLPVRSVLAIYAKENGEGMMLQGLDDDQPPPDGPPEPPGGDDTDPPPASPDAGDDDGRAEPRRRGHLKVIK